MAHTLPWDPRALWVVEQLDRAGYDAALVGGCVRDALLSLPPHDYDAATSALPKQVEALFADTPRFATGSRYGTITVVAGGLPVEVTTFRREGDYSDHRRPDRVEFTSGWRTTWPAGTSPSTPCLAARRAGGPVRGPGRPGAPAGTLCGRPGPAV